MRSVWETMAWDIFDSMATEGRPPECTQEEVIELVLDANRLEMFCQDPAIRPEVDEFIKLDFYVRHELAKQAFPDQLYGN